MDKTVYERVSELEDKIRNLEPKEALEPEWAIRIEEGLGILMKDYERRMKHLERVANSKRVKKRGV